MADCKDCSGLCCNYITIQIDEPSEDIDWEEIKWWLCHENIIVYIDNDDDWCVEVKTNCKNLGKANECLIYEKRPKVCSDHETDECEANETLEPYYKRIFLKMEDVDEYRKTIQSSKKT